MRGSRRTASCSTLLFLVAMLAAMLVSVVLIPGIARAQSSRGTALHVLEIDSDDADEQAEALTAALRSKVRASSGWVLLDTTQSLSMLTAALRCPTHPDSACLQRIGDQLKTDRFIWGLMTKSQHQVTAEVHLWTRNKADTVVKEPYSENLKDQNDDSLRKIAARIFERLTGVSSGTLVISAGGEAGTVLVDNEQRGQLDHGHATIQVPTGIHVVQVRGANLDAHQNVTVVANQNVEVSFPVNVLPMPPPIAPEPPREPEPGKPFPVRKVVGWALTGVGIAAVAVAATSASMYFYATGNTVYDTNLFKQQIGSNTTIRQACAAGGSVTLTPEGKYVCGVNQRAITTSTIALVSGSVAVAALATGIILLATGTSTEEGASQPQVRLHLLPYASPQAAGLDVHLSF
jgi:hypothetical protein